MINEIIHAVCLAGVTIYGFEKWIQANQPYWDRLNRIAHEAHPNIDQKSVFNYIFHSDVVAAVKLLDKVRNQVGDINIQHVLDAYLKDSQQTKL